MGGCLYIGLINISNFPTFESGVPELFYSRCAAYLLSAADTMLRLKVSVFSSFIIA